MSQIHEQEKLRLTEGSDKSLTVSELNELIGRAVEEATAPLEERISQLERGTVPASRDAPAALPGASRRLDLAELDDQNEFEDEDKDIVSSKKRSVR